MIKNNKNFAFTLAEVLITLAIIGIVAAITIPSLVQKYQEKARVTALKKFYATITQAVQMAIIEHGTPDMWGISGEHPEVMLTTIFPYIKIMQNIAMTVIANVTQQMNYINVMEI